MSLAKNLLGNVPFAADLYDSLRKSRPNTRYNLEQLAKHADQVQETPIIVPSS